MHANLATAGGDRHKRRFVLAPGQEQLPLLYLLEISGFSIKRGPQRVGAPR